MQNRKPFTPHSVFQGHKERYTYESYFPRKGESYPEQVISYSERAQQLGSNYIIKVKFREAVVDLKYQEGRE